MLLVFIDCIGSLAGCSIIVFYCVVSMCIHFAILFIILLLQHMRATSNVKCMDLLIADSYLAMNLVNPICDCYNIGCH